MSQELRTFTVNLKSLDQDIRDPIVAGGADAAGRTFRIIFDQEAEAQITPETQVYLSWFHQQRKTKGYNVFTQTNDDPITWEIKWPQSMLMEGDVLCCIELVDSVSIAQSTNFIVHVLSDPNDGSSFVVSDDFTLFQNAVIRLNCIGDQMIDQMTQQKIEFEDMQLKLGAIENYANDALDKSNEALERVETIEKRVEVVVEKTEDSVKKAEETLKRADAALDAVDNKVDYGDLGFSLTEETPTVKDWIENKIKNPHLEVIEFIGEDE